MSSGASHLQRVMPLHGLTDTRHSAAVTHSAFHAAVALRQGTITRVSHYPTCKVNLKSMAAIRWWQAGLELGIGGFGVGHDDCSVLGRVRDHREVPGSRKDSG